MSAENVLLHHNDFYDVIRKRALVRAFPDFVARSTALKRIRVDPKADPKALLALFADYSIELSRYVGGGEDHVLKRDGHLVRMDVSCGTVAFAVHSRDAGAPGLLAGLLKRLEPFKPVDKEEDGVWADFSFLTADGVERRTEFLRCPNWADVRANYPSAIRARLDSLLNLPEPWTHGRLIVWHGLPGTGKTWAIRSLLMHWRDRFDFSVVVDPELLARNPAYYYEMASPSRDTLNRRFIHHRLHYEDDLAALEEDGVHEEPAPRRKVFIMEDCADLVLAQGRAENGEKIGRLLNMTDGLFGQGRQDLFLITFNEDEDRIDPAFLRPGRCLANLKFEKFEPKEAGEWLAGKGVEGAEAGREMSLAEMYERVSGGTKGELLEERAVPAGFGAGKGRRAGAGREGVLEGGHV